jgi:type VI secretion system secreted protein Hcp
MALVSYYLKIDGIDGESSDSKHKGEIEVESFSWGETNAGSHGAGGGGGTGRVAMQAFMFTIRANKASPKLFLACANGEHIKKAVLTCSKAGKQQQDYLKWTLSDLNITSYQTSGNSADVIPLDTVGMDFEKIEVEYKEQKPDGSLGGAVTAGWKVKEHDKV